MAQIPALLLCMTAYVHAANILYVEPFTSKSHNIMLRPIGLELARRGHNVTVITAYPEKDYPPTFHQVIADNTTIWEAKGSRPNVFTTVDISAEEFHDAILWGGGLASTEISLKSAEVQRFLHQDHQFDLVISEQFFQEALYVLAHKYKAPLALITTFGNCMRHNIITRNPLQLATVIPEFLDVNDPKSFWGKLRTVYFTAYEYFWWRFWYLEKQNELVKKYIPGLEEPVPSLIELQREAALIMINSHFSFDTPVAYGPNIVEIGGIHFKEVETQLPKLPIEKKKAFLKVFSKLKLTVLWKWEEDNMENKPDNVFTRKWMPQKEILSHPNIKVFIAHGGLIGMQEAIYHGVPIIGVPVYADQYNNLLQAQDIGFARILKYHDINEHNLESILEDVINDKSYKNKAKEISRRYMDRPLSPLDTAMFWIEYVLRNKGAEFMKNPARRLSWVEYNMLDVGAFVLVLLLVFMFVFVKIVSVLKSVVSGSKENDKRKKKLQ